MKNRIRYSHSAISIFRDKISTFTLVKLHSSTETRLSRSSKVCPQGQRSRGDWETLALPFFPNITNKQLCFKTRVLNFPGDACKYCIFISRPPLEIPFRRPCSTWHYCHRGTPSGDLRRFKPPLVVTKVISICVHKKKIK